MTTGGGKNLLESRMQLQLCTFAFFQTLEKENQILIIGILKGGNVVFITTVSCECICYRFVCKGSVFPMPGFSVMKNKSNHACKIKNIPNFKIACLDAEMGKKQQIF